MSRLPKSRKARLFYVVFLVLILASSVPLTALTFYKLKVERDGLAERLKDDLENVVQSVSRNLQLYVDGRQREADLLARALSILPVYDAEAVGATLEGFGPQMKDSFRVLQVIDRQFKVISAFDTQQGALPQYAGRTLAGHADMDEALGPKGFGVTDVFQSEVTASLSVRLAVPILGTNDNVKGFVAGTVDLRDLSWAVSVPSPFPTQIYIVDGVGNQMMADGAVPNYISPLGDVMLWNRMKGVSRAWLPEEKVGSLRYSPGLHVNLSATGWHVLAQIPEDFVATRIEQFHWSSIGLLMITFLVVVVLAALLSNFIVLPISRFKSVAFALASRDFSPDKVLSIPTVYDEVDTISHAFEDMVLKVDRYFHEVVATRDALTFGLTTIVEFRDPETGYHVERIAHYCREIAQKLGKADDSGLSAERIDDVFRAAPLHDVGKVAIPDSILLKPDQLTPREFEIMKTHTTAGAQAIASIQRKLPGASFLPLAAEIALSHHEWWDGSGYPSGLKGVDIPLAARILSLADVYDALAFPRIYRPYRFSHEEIVELVLDKSGTHFDPEIVDVFKDSEDVFVRIRTEFAEAGDSSATGEPSASPA